MLSPVSTSPARRVRSGQETIMELQIAYYAGGNAYYSGIGMVMPVPTMLVVSAQPLGSPVDKNTRTVHLPKRIDMGVRGCAPKEFCFLRAPISEDSRRTVKWIVRLVLGENLWAQISD